jgi:hypothetical protein
MTLIGLPRVQMTFPIIPLASYFLLEFLLLMYRTRTRWEFRSC